MSKDRKTLTLEYLNAVGKQQYDRLEAMLAPDLQFRGPSMTRTSAAEYLGALKRLGAIHVRNDVKRVFVDGDEVCVIYDFVTDTAAGALPTIEWLRFDGDEACVIYDFVTDTQAGALPTIEWLRFEGDRVSAIDLYYDRLPWQAVMAVIAERAARPAASAVV